MFSASLSPSFLVPLLGGPLSRNNVNASGSRGVYEGAALSTGQLRAIRRLPQLRIQRGFHDEYTVSRQVRSRLYNRLVNIEQRYPCDANERSARLIRLRRDSEAVAQRPAASWEDTSREGRDSVVTTSSGSASSSETLKWHGSMSDVSVSSGMPPRQGPSDRWHHGSMSDVSSVNGGILTQKSNNGCHEKWQSSMSDVSTSGIIPSSMKGRHSLDSWQTSMNDRNKQGRSSLPAVIGHCVMSTSINNICQTSAVRESKWQESNIDDDSLNDRSQADHQWDNSSRLENDKYAQPQSPTCQQIGSASPQNSDNWNSMHGSMSDVSQSNGMQCSKQLIAHSARVQTPQRHHSESVLYLDHERNQRKLYPVSTTQPQESSHSSRYFGVPLIMLFCDKS